MADRVSDSVIFAVTGNERGLCFYIVGRISHGDPDSSAGKHTDIVIVVAEAVYLLKRNLILKISKKNLHHWEVLIWEAFWAEVSLQVKELKRLLNKKPLKKQLQLQPTPLHVK